MNRESVKKAKRRFRERKRLAHGIRCKVVDCGNWIESNSNYCNQHSFNAIFGRNGFNKLNALIKTDLFTAKDLDRELLLLYGLFLKTRSLMKERFHKNAIQRS